MTPLAVAHPGRPPSGWYALRVFGTREFAVQRRLRELAIEEYLPTITTETRWSDRIKRSERPLYPGYLFARFALSDWRVRRIEHVIDILGTPHNPLPVTDPELAEVRRVLAQLTAHTKPGRMPTYPISTPVIVQLGAFAGQRGIVTRAKGERIAVALLIFGHVRNVEMDAADVSLDQQAMEKAA